MTKNLRFGFVAYDAILSCMLAKKGFTGPVRVVEGDSGLSQVILRGNMDLERLVDFSGWRILNVWHKFIAACGTISANILATLAIVKEHDLKPEDIAAVRIRDFPRGVEHTTTFAKKYPRNAESADHSIFYLNAQAIKERACGADSIKPEKFTDPVVLDLIEKITVEGDTSIPASSYGGASEITTKDGRKFEKHIVWPHGYGDSQMTDKEIEDKFSEMASKYMKKDQINQIIDTSWNVEKLDDMGVLMKLMVFPSQ